eukprot:366290-Chlamydomonas_euryale.AAC.3
MPLLADGRLAGGRYPCVCFAQPLIILQPVLCSAIHPSTPQFARVFAAQGRSGAIAVIAVAKRGSLFDPGPVMYMEKIAVGPNVPAKSISLDFPVEKNLQAVAKALGKPIGDVTVLVLDRPRHAVSTTCSKLGTSA